MIACVCLCVYVCVCMCVCVCECVCACKLSVFRLVPFRIGRRKARVLPLPDTHVHTSEATVSNDMEHIRIDNVTLGVIRHQPADGKIATPTQHTHTDTRTHTHIHIHTYTHIHRHKHTYSHTHTLTNTHTQTTVPVASCTKRSCVGSMIRGIVSIWIGVGALYPSGSRRCWKCSGIFSAVKLATCRAQLRWSGLVVRMPRANLRSNILARWRYRATSGERSLACGSEFHNVMLCRR
jgi:hypothetical protein